MNNSNNDNKKLTELLKLTAEKLGTTPDNLKSAAQNGDLSKILANSQNENIKKILSDPEKTKKLLMSEQAKKLMKQMGLENKEN